MPEIGARVLAEEPAVVSDLARVCSMWTDALRDSSGPFLFGDFSIADAYYAPMAGRLRSYGLPMNALVTGYVEHLFATKAVAAWVIDALQEHDFVAEDEPYRSSPNPAA